MKNALSLCLAVVVAGCASTPASSDRVLTENEPRFVLSEHRFWPRELAPVVPDTWDHAPEDVAERVMMGEEASNVYVVSKEGAKLEMWPGGPMIDSTSRVLWEVVSRGADDTPMRLMLESKGFLFFMRMSHDDADASLITHRTTLHNVRGEPFALLPRGYDVQEKSHPKSNDEIAFVCLSKSECAVRGFVHRSNLGPFFSLDDELAFDEPKPVASLWVMSPADLDDSSNAVDDFEDRQVPETTLLDRHGQPSVSAKFSSLQILEEREDLVEVTAEHFGATFYGFVRPDFVAEQRELMSRMGGLGLVGMGMGGGGMLMGASGCVPQVEIAPGVAIHGVPDEDALFAILVSEGPRSFDVADRNPQAGWLSLKVTSPWGEHEGFVRESDVASEVTCAP